MRERILPDGRRVAWVIACCSLLTFTATGSGQPESAAVPFPRIAMLWSGAEPYSRKHADDLSNWAKHSLILNGVDDFGLEWSSARYPAMAETFDPESVAEARRKVARLKALNPRAV